MARMNEASVSLWDDCAQEPDHSDPMDGDSRCELAIVGGGFTGLSTALHAAQAGHDCHVLEAHRIGHGGSGRNVGLVNAGVWLPPQDVRKRLGEERGARLVDLLGRAPDHVFALIEKHQIRCEATRKGTIHAAHSPRGFQDLQRRAEEWNRLGAPVELVSAEAAAARIGSRAFCGGLIDHRAGTINPMGYARGLARAALAAGARISTDTAVTSLSRQADRWVLHTDRGTVHARKVVIGTNAYTDGLWPGLKDALTVIDFFQVATEPLGERAAHILPGGQGLWDTAPVMFSLRRDASGRLAIGSMGRLIGADAALTRRWARRRLDRLFPELGPVGLERAWHGKIAMTPDHLPRIYRLAEGLYAPIGYNGRGIAPGTVFGKAVAGLISGEPEEALPMPLGRPTGAPARRVKSWFYRSVFAADQWLKSR